MSLDTLQEELSVAMSDACRASLARHSGEEFYCVALYTSGSYDDLVDSVATFQGLEKVALEYLEDKHYQDEWGTLEAAMRELKWSPCDSPYHCEFEGKFGRVNEIIQSCWQEIDHHDDGESRQLCRRIHETAIAVLKQVRDSGLFDPSLVVFNLLMGDQSDEERLVNAEELNSPHIIEQFRGELVIDDEELGTLRRTLQDDW